MRLAREFASTVLLTAFFVLLAGPRVQAQPLADRVPADAVIYLGWAGSQHMGPGYEQSHLKAVLDASAIQQLIDESIPRLLEKIGHGDRGVAEITAMVSQIGGAMWRHPTAVYFGGIDMPGNPQQPPMPKLAVLCEAGADAKALADRINALIPRDPNRPLPLPIRVEAADGLLVAVVGNVDIGAGKKPANPLSGRKEFQSAMAQLVKSPVMAIYIDVAGGVEQFEALAAQQAPPDFKQMWPKIRDSIGLPSLKRISATAGFDGKDWSSATFIESPEPRSGIVKALIDGQPLSQEILRAIPRSATLASAGQLDLNALFTEITNAVRAIEPRAGQEMDQGLAEIKQAIGLDLQADIIATFGQEWAMYMDPTVAGNGILGLTIVNRLRDPAKAEKALSQLEALANNVMKDFGRRDKLTLAFATTKQKDLTIHYLAIPGIAPCWAVKDGFLYVALYPQVISGAADHVASRGKSILDNEDFLSLRKRLGQQNPTAIGFLDLPKTAPESYQDVLLLSRLYLGLADLFGAKTPAMILPPLAKLMPHLSVAGGVSWVDKDGWHQRSVEPFPGSQLLGTSGMGALIVAQQAAIMAAFTRASAPMRHEGHAAPMPPAVEIQPAPPVPVPAPPRR